MSIYQPTLMFIKFSEKEKELLKLVFFNYLFVNNFFISSVFQSRKLNYFLHTF